MCHPICRSFCMASSWASVSSMKASLGPNSSIFAAAGTLSRIQPSVFLMDSGKLRCCARTLHNAFPRMHGLENGRQMKLYPHRPRFGDLIGLPFNPYLTLLADLVDHLHATNHPSPKAPDYLKTTQLDWKNTERDPNTPNYVPLA